MPTIETIYLGNLHTENTHIQSGTKISTDAPNDHKGKGESFSPTDLAATALGSCYLTFIAIKSQETDILFDGSHAAVSKVMSADPPRRIIRIETMLHLTTNRTLSTEEKVYFENIARTCPVALSLHPEIEQKISFVWG